MFYLLHVSSYCVACEDGADMKIKIGPQKFKVVHVRDLRDKKDVSYFGLITYGKSIIEIEDSIDKFSKHQVLWHEILHGLLTQAGISNHEESMIDALAYGIIQVLDDNKTLRKGIE